MKVGLVIAAGLTGRQDSPDRCPAKRSLSVRPMCPATASLPGISAFSRHAVPASRPAGQPLASATLAATTADGSAPTSPTVPAVVDADSGQILGCAVLGVEGGEIMTIIQVAMLGKLTYTAMAGAVFNHPLLAEGLNSLFMTLGAESTVRVFQDISCGIWYALRRVESAAATACAGRQSWVPPRRHLGHSGDVTRALLTLRSC